MILENNEHPIERIMDTAMGKIRTFLTADTVVGQPVHTADGVSIVPISKVTMGFLTGGGEYGDSARDIDYPFAGGSGAGVAVSPIGFLVSDGKSVKLVSVDEKSILDKMLDTIPEVIDGLFQK